VLTQDTLAKAMSVRGHRCLLLDVVSEGKGGPDFKLGDAQTTGSSSSSPSRRRMSNVPSFSCTRIKVIFPKAASRSLARAFADAGVAMVDTGHTHYNELLNEGSVIYAATRSTGQIEEDEGRAGFSIATVDGNVASWRFQRLDERGPLVVIKSPADRRLVTDPHNAQQVPTDACVVCAKVFGKAVVNAVASVAATRAVM
jgi:Icc protein